MTKREQIVFSWTPLAEALDAGGAELVERHWAEVAIHKDEVPLSCDWDRYFTLEEQGIFKVMTAMRGARLVGYSSYIIMPHLHYSTTIHAHNDAIFIDPAARGVGIRLIQAAEKALALLASPACIRILYHAKLHVAAERGSFAKVFEHLGYPAFETGHDKVVRA
jgi:hypothetical protein